jgi:hypothetical protein
MTGKKRPTVPPFAEIIEAIAGIKNKRDASKCIGHVLRSRDIPDADRFIHLIMIELNIRTVETNARLTLIERALGLQKQKRSRVLARRKSRSTSMVQH